MKRACGILLPVFSLPGSYGIGCFSVKAYEFVDMLKAAEQTYWQILPLGPTGFGDSPYQSFSTFAGNPYFIDLDELIHQGYLTQGEVDSRSWGQDARLVDYGKMWENRDSLLRTAFDRFREAIRNEPGWNPGDPAASPDAAADFPHRLTRAAYEKARAELPEGTKEYCLYRAIKNAHGGKSWMEWEDPLRRREPAALGRFCGEHADEVEFGEWKQIVFLRQWNRLHSYAAAHGVKIIGDLPIYVAPDSAEAWAHPELFQMDAGGRPDKVAGCPPDYFSPDGQMWGNPLYDWDYLKKTDYAWWMKRLEYAFSIYDYVRIDHFRAFDEYYAIPAGDQNARNGAWEKGPGMDFFRAVKKHFEKEHEELPVIAEDLGLLTPSVLKLVEDTGFPGMKVLEFAYDSDSRNLYLPHNYIRNCVAYTGTHDNEPLMSWIRSQNGEIRLHMIRYQGSEHTPENELYWDCIRTVLASIADTVIIPMWDYLGAGPEARINAPSSAQGNWRWRMVPGEFSDNLTWHCSMLAKIYGRERAAAVEVPEENTADRAEQ